MVELQDSERTGGLMSSSASRDTGGGSAVERVDRSAFEGFAERLLAVWNDHDTTDLPALVTDDVVWNDPAIAEPAIGPAGVQRFMEDSWRAYPDLHFDVIGPACFADDAPIAMVPWRMTGTQLGPIDPPGYAPTGRRIDVTGIDVYTFRGGRIAHYQAQWDIVTVARQLGIMPAAGSLGERLQVALQRATVRVHRRDP